MASYVEYFNNNYYISGRLGIKSFGCNYYCFPMILCQIDGTNLFGTKS